MSQVTVPTQRLAHLIWLVPAVSALILGAPLLGLVRQTDVRIAATEALRGSFNGVLMLNWANGLVATCFVMLLAVAFGFLSYLRGRLPAPLATMLLLPAALGSYGHAFLVRNVYDQQTWLQRIVGATEDCPRSLIFVSLAVLQYAPLVALVMMAGVRPREIDDLARIHRLTIHERFRDCYWPQTANLAAVMAAAVFFFTVNGAHTFERVVKPAPGKDYETIASWVFREFYAVERAARIDPHVFGQAIAGVASVGTLLCGILVGSMIPSLIRWISQASLWIVARRQVTAVWINVGHIGLSTLLIAAALYPLWGLVGQSFSLRILVPPPHLSAASIFALLAGILLFSLAASWAITVRYRWPDLDSSHRRMSLVLAALVGTLSLQPLFVYFAASQWASILPDTGRFQVLQAFWLVGMCALYWPVLAAFQLVTMTSVRAEDFHFHRTYRSSFGETFKTVLLLRFPESVCFSLLFAFLFAWFDVDLNHAFENTVYSLATVQQAASNARHLDAAHTLRLAFWMLLPVMVALLFFRRIMATQRKEAL